MVCSPRRLESDIPSYWCLICSVVHNLHIDSHARQIRGQHETSRAGSHDADITLGWSLWHGAQKGQAVDVGIVRLGVGKAPVSGHVVHRATVENGGSHLSLV